MSALTYPACAAFTRKAEGGWSNNPADPGGCTMQGVTLATYTEWCAEQEQPKPTPAQLEAISPDAWNAIAGTRYWNPVHGDTLPAGVDLSVFDFGFNAAPSRSARVLQQLLGLTGNDVDGWIGPETLKLLATHTPSYVIAGLADRQAAYYRGLAAFPTFGKGWLARTTARRDAALALVAGHGAAPVVASQADDFNALQLAKDTP